MPRLRIPEWLQIAFAFVLALPVILFFAIPWLAWALQFFPSE